MGAISAGLPASPPGFNRPSYRLASVEHIRRCRDDEREEIFEIVNAAAEAYRGVIPADRWHEPYMPLAELDAEIAAGVVFWGYADGGRLTGIMGIQDVGDVDLIRHAYVLPERQGRGVGGALLEQLLDGASRRMLVGTWAAAEWRSTSTNGTASRWSRANEGRSSCAGTGASRSARSRPRWCWRSRRSRRACAGRRSRSRTPPAASSSSTRTRRRSAARRPTSPSRRSSSRGAARG